MKVHIDSVEWWPVYVVEEDDNGVEVPDDLVRRQRETKAAFEAAEETLVPYAEQQEAIEQRRESRGRVQRDIARIKASNPAISDEELHALVQEAL